MGQLKAVRKLIQRPVRRSRIIKLVDAQYGQETPGGVCIINSCDLTTTVYRGKKRKNGEAKISHEREMFIILAQELEIIDSALATAIFLHDLHEDNQSKWPLSKIEDLFGGEVRCLVDAVTKPSLNSFDLVSKEFSFEVAKKVRLGGKKAMILKIIDRFHFFLKPFKNHDREKLIWKIAQTLHHILPMALELETLAVELQLIVSDCIRKNKITTEEIARYA